MNPGVLVSTVRSRLIKSLVAFMLIVSIGWHWAILQGVAWASMLVEYGRHSSSISEAVAKTFDGKHPCNVCKLVKSGKAAEKNESAEKNKTKLDFWVNTPPAQFAFSQFASVNFAAFDPAIRGRTEAPPLPPPRAA